MNELQMPIDIRQPGMAQNALLPAGMGSLRVLFAGEESQECTKAFRLLGHEAFSCDLKDCSGGKPEWHIKGCMKQAIRNNDWDMVFFFPDCTFITCSAEWAYKEPPYHQKVKPGTLVGKERIKARNDALQFICDILNLCEQKGIKMYGFENPVGVIPKRIFRYYNETTKQRIWKVFPSSLNAGGLEASQYIQPYEFGDDASKKTGLWLFGLPLLQSTGYVDFKRYKCKCGNVFSSEYGKYGCCPEYAAKPLFGNQTDSGQNNISPCENRAELRSKTYPGIAAAMAMQWGGNARR